MRTIEPLTIAQIERFAAKIRISETGCWLWTGALTSNGYGLFALGHSWQRSAHRVAYTLTKGKIPEGLQLDHLCKIRNCVNPNHLEAVTLAENVKRSSLGDYLRRLKQTETCKHGHVYTPENTHYMHPQGKRPYRQCRQCERGYWKRTRMKRRQRDKPHSSR